MIIKTGINVWNGLPSIECHAMYEEIHKTHNAIYRMSKFLESA